MDDILEIWSLFFPAMGEGWPELDLGLAELGLGVRLPAPLRSLLLHARPPDREYDFRAVRLLDPDGIEWDAKQPSVLVFAEMTDMGLKYGMDEATIRDDSAPVVLCGDGSGPWQPLRARLDRWLREYALLTRLEAAPRTGWLRCGGPVVRALDSGWDEVLVDWSPTPPAGRRAQPFQGLRSPLAARLRVRGDVVVEIISDGEIVAAASTREHLIDALVSLGIEPSVAERACQVDP